MKENALITIEYTTESHKLERAHHDDAGLDLPTLGDWQIMSGESRDIGTGIRIAIPEGYYGRITGRSSAHRRLGLTVREGIIDSGFRGELFAYVTNENQHIVDITNGQHIAQLIVCPLPGFRMQQVDTLPDSERGTKGFGSSGS
jgi:dUTP pyrophosphatase